MNLAARQGLSAIGFFAIVATLIAGAASAAYGLRTEQGDVAALTEQAQALEMRARRLKPPKSAQEAVSPFLDAPTITLAGAGLQQRVEAAVVAASGRLASSKVEVGGRGAERKIGLEAELTISELNMQKLLYDLETGRPYLFVEAFEARAPEKTDAATSAEMHVSLTVSGQWGGPK